jgi:CSLREA domain-containing protein
MGTSRACLARTHEAAACAIEPICRVEEVGQTPAIRRKAARWGHQRDVPENSFNLKNTTSFRVFLVSGVLLAGLVLGAAVNPPVLAATFTVNIKSDSHDSNPGDGKCADANGKCSLRAAIEEINWLPAFPPGEIALPAGIYKLTLGALEIAHSLDLNGAAAASTAVDANKKSNVLLISNPGTDPIVNISGVTIQNGDGGINFDAGIRVSPGVFLVLTDSVVTGNQSSVGGVGIVNSGVLTILRSTVRDNVITGGGGGLTGTGAGIFNIPDSQTTPALPAVLKVVESTISNNTGIRGEASPIPAASRSLIAQSAIT